jgi:hypothetical protein
VDLQLKQEYPNSQVRHLREEVQGIHLPDSEDLYYPSGHAGKALRIENASMARSIRILTNFIKYD